MVGGRASPRKRRTRSATSIESGEIDLGAIAVEHLALGLDPYPRARGRRVPGHIEDEAGPADSPFAALERLKRDPE